MRASARAAILALSGRRALTWHLMVMRLAWVQAVVAVAWRLTLVRLAPSPGVRVACPGTWLVRLALVQWR